MIEEGEIAQDGGANFADDDDDPDLVVNGDIEMEGDDDEINIESMKNKYEARR